MLDQIQKWLILAAFVAVVGGILSIIVSMILPQILGMAGMLSPIVSAAIALILLIVIAANTKFDDIEVFDLIILFLAVGIIGSIVTVVLPMAAPYILSTAIGVDWVSSLAWTFVYVGAAIWAKDKVM